MENKVQKLIVIGGPTGSGKTDLAIKIAKEFDGELINADSRQIYKYLDIGTNKGRVKSLKLKVKSSILSELPIFSISEVPIHLLSFLNPDQRFDVFRFQELAYALIENITSRGKVPILVGGTGLYIDSVLKSYRLEVTGDQDRSIRKYFGMRSLIELQEMLEAQSSGLMASLNDSDRNNPRRLIRLIEKSQFNSPNNLELADNEKLEEVEELGNKYKHRVEHLFLYPKFDWEELKKKIEQRVLKMFEEGLIQEVEKVLEMGFSSESVALQGIGYREVLEYLNKPEGADYNPRLLIQKIQISHRQYAKRQRTWFEGKGRGYDLKKVDGIEKARVLINAFLKNN